MRIFKKIVSCFKGKSIISRISDAENIMRVIDLTLQASGKNRAYRRRFWNNFVKVAVFGKEVK